MRNVMRTYYHYSACYCNQCTTGSRRLRREAQRIEAAAAARAKPKTFQGGCVNNSIIDGIAACLERMRTVRDATFRFSAVQVAYEQLGLSDFVDLLQMARAETSAGGRTAEPVPLRLARAAAYITLASLWLMLGIYMTHSMATKVYANGRALFASIVAAREMAHRNYRRAGQTTDTTPPQPPCQRLAKSRSDAERQH